MIKSVFIFKPELWFGIRNAKVTYIQDENLLRKTNAFILYKSGVRGGLQYMGLLTCCFYPTKNDTVRI